MSKKTILSKSAICGSVYLIFPFLILLVVYGLDNIISNPFVVATLFGAICGTIIALVTNCGELKRTSIARAFGILAVIVVELLLEIFLVSKLLCAYFPFPICLGVHIWNDIFTLLVNVKSPQVEDFFIDYLVNDEKIRPEITNVAYSYFV